MTAAFPEPAVPLPGWQQIADALWLAAMTGSGPMNLPARETAAEREPSSLSAADLTPPDSAAPALTLPASTGPGTPLGRGRPPRTAPAEIDDAGDSPLSGVLRAGRSIEGALKPFKRRVPSTTSFEPDEEATAEFGADAGYWMPRFRAVADRWLSLVLIVDQSPTMAAWRPTVTALRLLLERHGSFRAVRTVLLSPAWAPDGGTTRTDVRLGGPAGVIRSPSELLDPTGRQMFMVVTDGLHPAWRGPAVARLLRLWAGSGPLVMVNPYPQSYWHRGVLSPRSVSLRAARTAGPNNALRVRFDPVRQSPFDDPVPPGAIVVPIVELSPRWLGWWADLMTGTPVWRDAIVFAVAPEPEDGVPAEGAPDRDVDPADLVLRFRRGASPGAFRLATLIAAAPLDLPMLHRVQRALLPGASPHHMAEVLTSPLVTQPSGPGASYEFVDGVREVLLSCASRDDTARVVRAVASHRRHPGSSSLTLTSAIESPDLAAEPEVTEAALPMARIELAVLDALSGPYAARAGRLRAAITSLERRLAGEESPGEPNPPQLEPVTTGDDDNPGAARGGPPPGGEESGEDMATPHPEPMDARDEISADDLLPEDASLLSLQEFLEGQSQDTGPAVWGSVPTRNPVFTGRRALLEQLERRLRTQSLAAVLPQALHGEGGVGKSQIAIEYAYRHRADFDVIWWVPSERPAQILASLIELGDKLGLAVGNDVITAVPRVRAALRAGTPYSNWLLVFDNAEKPETIKDYFPEGGTGKVLVTSRNQDWSQIAESLEVDVFTRDESIRLLRRRNPALTGAEADRLAEVLGDLPLAIEHASAWLFATDMPVDQYMGLLAAKRDELIALDLTPVYEMPVAAAANVALDRLAVENLAALQLLQVCSFLAPEPISRDLFSGGRSTLVSDELDEALQNPSRLGQAIRDIQKYVLARVDHRANTLQLHRLVQKVVKDRIAPEQRGALEHGAHILLAGGKPGMPSEPDQWLRYQALASHLIASNAHACEDGWSRDLVLNLIEFYFYWGDYASGRDLAAEVIDEWSGRLGRSHRQTLKASMWLGYYWWVLGEFAKSATIQQETRELCLETLGPEDEDTIEATTMVAATRRVSGRFHEARDLDLEAFRRSRATLGGDEPMTLRAAHNLGVSLRLTGEFVTARQLDADTYRRRVAVLGEDHPETLRTFNNLTIDQRECGEYIRSSQLVENLYARYVQLLGVGHVETIKVARNLAVARRRAGDHPGAFKLAEDTMNRFRDVFGERHPDAIAAALDFAVDLRESDNLDRALALAEKTADAYRDSLGADHPYTYYARTNLGIVLRLLGRTGESYAHNHAALQALERALGPTHLLTLTCGVNLASDLASVGDHQAAYDLDLVTLSRCRESIGSRHPTTLAVELNLAFDLVALGRTTEGDEMFEETITAYAEALGKAHPAIIAARAGERANCDVDPMQF